MEGLFQIFKVDTNEAKNIINSPDHPHQHDYEELIIVLQGKLLHFIDYKTHELIPPCISFVTKGKVHRLLPVYVDNKFDCWAIRFKSEFIPDITFQLYNYYHDRANFSLKEPQSIHRLDILCQLIQEEYNNQGELAIIKDLLTALFTIVETERKKVNADRENLVNNHNTTFKTFLQILEENFRRPEGVNFYADKLFMSSKSLNTITQSILHLPVSEIIETRKLIEAKKLLFTTDKSIAEIGYEIGYQDKAYFTSVFKKKSGQTPTEFREEMKRLLS